MLDVAEHQALFERHAIRLTAILASHEEYAPIYAKAPEQHATLIAAQAELQVTLVKFFKSMRNNASAFANWDQYAHQIAINHPHQLSADMLAYNVNVIVNEQQIDDNDGNFIKVSLKTVQKAVTAGFMAQEVLSGQPPLGIPSTAALIQKLSTEQVASLVGKKVLDDGSIIDNPDARYNIMDTVRNDIAQSITTSLGLGETTDEAIDRIKGIINPGERAELIAQTESVNAYQAGQTEFGKLSGAVGKVWQTVGANDVCQDYANLGPVPFDYEYGGNLDGPTAHPRCRCGRRLIYQEEWDSISH